MNPIQFYTSVDVTLSEKLLEVMYCIIGLISIYVAFKNLKDKENKKYNICNTELHKTDLIAKMITKNNIKINEPIKFINNEGE